MDRYLAEKYRGASISNIRYGENINKRVLLANITLIDGTVIVDTTLDYCISRMTEVAIILRNNR